MNSSKRGAAFSLPVTLALFAGSLLMSPGPARAACPGDCGSDGALTVRELVTLVRISLDSTRLGACPSGDTNRDGLISADEITGALSRAVGTEECTPNPPAALTRVRLTYLEVMYDLSKPAFVNSSVPIKFGITSESADLNNPGTQEVAVQFTFVEAEPADPDHPRTCDSNGIVLKLVGNGLEQKFEEDIFPTTECATWAEGGSVAILAVDFDRGLRESGTPTGIDYPPVVFSAANAGNADNQLCRNRSEPAAPGVELGCVTAIDLDPTPVDDLGKPLLDVKLESLKPDSSVAVLWPEAEGEDVPAGIEEDDPPAVLVNAVLLMEGRDPYKNKIDPSRIPPELLALDPTIADQLTFGLTEEELDAIDDLPSPALMKYDLVPTQLLAPDTWLPLSIDDPANPDPEGHVQEIAITELDPGTENGVVHGLYLDGDTRAAVSPGGDWQAETDFTVRGCLVASFPEGGNAGEVEDPEDVPAGGDVPAGDCKTFTVVLTRPPGEGGIVQPSETPASSHSFDMTWGRSVGDAARAQITGTLRTTNTLDLTGARSDSEGLLELKGYWNIRLFRIYGKANALTALATSNYDVGVEVFGISLAGNQQAGAELNYETPLTFARSFDFPVFGYAFGPISVGITAGVGGTAGLTPRIALSAKEGPEASVPALSSATANGSLAVTLTPSAALTGNVTGGVNLWVARAQVAATVRVAEIGFPVTASMRWGVTETDPGTSAVKKLAVLGDVKWDMTLTWLNLSVDAVGSIGWCPFCIGRTINVLQYSTPTETTNLLTRQLAEPITLEAPATPPG